MDTQPQSATLILTQSNVHRLLTPNDAVAAVEDVFRSHGLGNTRMPAKVYLELPEHQGDFRAMPAFDGEYAGVKWVNVHPRNVERQPALPTVMGVFILSDPATGAPLAIMDATLLTALRTGAAAAVASKHLARKRPKSVGIIGCGAQAGPAIEAHRAVFGTFELRCADRSPQAAERVAKRYDGKATSIEEAADCEIICTLTPSRSPYLKREWVKPGTHINAMGADAPGKQELEIDILKNARIVVDEWEQAHHSGEINVAYHNGQVTKADIRATVGEVILGKRIRESDSDITVFDSTGLGVQDVSLAARAYEKASAASIGLAYNLLA